MDSPRAASAGGQVPRARFVLGTLFVSLLGLAASPACRTKPPDEADYVSRIIAVRAEKDKALSGSNDPIPENRKADYLPLSYYPVDPAYSVPARFSPMTAVRREEGNGEAGQGTRQPQVVLLPTSTGTVEEARYAGRLEFMLDGQQRTLTAFASGEAGLFVPFRDLTSGSDTYEAGRYLNLEQSITGVYELDFNKAYNPYCYYNPMYTCPYPPPENRLDVHIRAGETIRPSEKP